jgi:tetratricopeptide (TPR) repeat protein
MQQHIKHKAVIFISFIMLATACQPREQRDTSIPPLPEGEANTYKVRLQVLNDAINDYPSNGEFYYKRAYLYFGNEQWTQALDDMNQALELDPNNGKYYLLRARLHQHAQQPEQAYADIQKAEKLQVQSTEFYTLLGELYVLRKEYDKAREALDKSLETAPYNGTAFYWKGAAAAETGDTTVALKFLAAALQYQPGKVETYDRLAGIFQARKDTVLTKKFATQGLQLASGHAGLHFKLANVYKVTGKSDSAKIHYKKALELNPSLYLAHYHLGEIYVQEKNYQQAVNTFTSLRAYDKKLPDIYYLAGLSHERMGNKEEALAHYQQGLELNANNTKLQKQYNTLKWAIDHPYTQKPAILQSLEPLPAITPEIKPNLEQQ